MGFIFPTLLPADARKTSPYGQLLDGTYFDAEFGVTHDEHKTESSGHH